jgi:hypothetical protein
VPQDATAVRHTAKDQSRAHCQPRAYGALGKPCGAEEGRARRKDAPAALPPPSDFGGQRRRDGEGGDRAPTASDGERHACWQHGQLHCEPDGSGEFVIRLANALRREVPRRRGAPRDEDIVQQHLTSAGGHHGANELEILEQRAAVIPAGGDQHRATHRDCSWPVTASHTIEKYATGVPACMPGQRIEIVLRTNHVGEVERGHHPTERRLVVTDVIVGDNHSLMRRQPYPGEHAADLTHLGRQIAVGRYVTQADMECVGPGRSMRREDRGWRSIDNDGLGAFGQPAQIRGELVSQYKRRRSDRQNVAETSGGRIDDAFECGRCGGSHG